MPLTAGNTSVQFKITAGAGRLVPHGARERGGAVFAADAARE